MPLITWGPISFSIYFFVSMTVNDNIGEQFIYVSLFLITFTKKCFQLFSSLFMFINLFILINLFMFIVGWQHSLTPIDSRSNYSLYIWLVSINVLIVLLFCKNTFSPIIPFSICLVFSLLLTLLVSPVKFILFCFFKSNSFLFYLSYFLDDSSYSIYIYLFLINSSFSFMRYVYLYKTLRI